MNKKDDLKNTMAAVFTMEPAKGDEVTEALPEEKPKRRRRSVIDKDPLPEASKKVKRTRRRKDPALVKSYSMTVLMTEEMHQRLRNLAEIQGLSMNGIVTRLIRKYIVLHDVDINDL